MTVGLLTLLAWPRLPVGELVHEVFPALAFSTVAFWTVAICSAPTANESVRGLFGDEPT